MALFMSGLFNIQDPILGQPLYIYLWLFLIFCAVVSYVVWRFAIWSQYRPLWGLFFSYKNESQFAFIFNKSLIGEMVSERDAKCIFDYSKWSYEGLSRVQAFLFNYATVFLPNLDYAHALLYKFGGKNQDVEIARTLQNHSWESESSVTSGGVHGDIILDYGRWSVRDSPEHAIIESTAEQWNDANPTDQVHAYPKFQKMLLDGILNCPPGIEPMVTVSWSRVDAAFPLGMSTKAPGFTREKAIEMENEEQSAISQYYIPVLGAGMGFAILLLLIRVVLMKVL